MGIDPSLRATGWAWLGEYGHGRVTRTGVVKTEGDRLRALVTIATEIARVINSNPRPTMIVMEGYRLGPRSSSQTILAEVGGVIKVTIFGAADVLLTVAPRQWKAAVLGKMAPMRKATKAEKRFYCDVASAHIGRGVSSTDEADAAMLALYGLNLYRGTYGPTEQAVRLWAELAMTGGRDGKRR